MLSQESMLVGKNVLWLNCVQAEPGKNIFTYDGLLEI